VEGIKGQSGGSSWHAKKLQPEKIKGIVDGKEAKNEKETSTSIHVGSPTHARL
jgi:hypothetical protein